jgi:hypothetical protein
VGIFSYSSISKEFSLEQIGIITATYQQCGA